MKLKSIIKGVTSSALLVMFTFFYTGCAFVPKEEEVLAPPLKEPEQITYDSIEVKKGKFENKISVTGYFISASQKDVSFQGISGRLKNIYVKSGDEVKAGTLIADMVTEDIETQIALQEISLKKAQINYDMIKASEKNKLAIDQANLDVEAEQIKLNLLNKKLAESKLIAPIDGMVDYVVNKKSGDLIEAYSTVVRIANPNDLRIKYSDNKTSSFKLGMSVSVKVGEKVLNGKVVMDPSNAPADAPSGGDEDTKKTVVIKADNLPQETKMGDMCDVILMLTKKDNVLVINKNLIHTVGARKFVYVLDNGVKKERDIEMGEENSTEVVIVKGLSEGEKIIKD